MEPEAVNDTNSFENALIATCSRAVLSHLRWVWRLLSARLTAELGLAIL
jgi:hypothetical protein